MMSSSKDGLSVIAKLLLGQSVPGNDIATEELAEVLNRCRTDMLLRFSHLGFTPIEQDLRSEIDYGEGGINKLAIDPLVAAGETLKTRCRSVVAFNDFPRQVGVNPLIGHHLFLTDKCRWLVLAITGDQTVIYGEFGPFATQRKIKTVEFYVPETVEMLKKFAQLGLQSPPGLTLTILGRFRDWQLAEIEDCDERLKGMRTVYDNLNAVLDRINLRGY